MTTPSVAFRFQAVDAAGVRHAGLLWVSDADEAVSRLGARGLTALSVRRARWRRIRRPSAEETADSLKQLADLLAAGLPLLPALDAVAASGSAAWQMTSAEVRRRVENGEPLSSAVAAAPLQLSRTLVGVIRSGEQGDGLAAGVTRAASHAERAVTFRRQLSEALAYPVVLLLAGVGSVTFLTAAVLPRFADLIAGLQGAVPASARTLIRVTTASGIVGWILLGCGIATLLAWLALQRSPTGRLITARSVELLPLVGRLWRRTQQAEMLQALAALLEAGVPVRRAVAVLSESTDDVLRLARLHEATQSLVRGLGLAESLTNSSLLDGRPAMLVAHGESAGHSASACARAASSARQEVDSTLRRALRLLEPTIIIGLALVTAGIGSVMLQAMYALRP